ncbi:hypothetical protein GF322_00490 [Candidatus Dependentiae bacterium]|nr:hypothetical protein [Candidatus Dependentiae bacterium]
MITQKIIDKVKQKLIEAYNPNEIYIFGSYAWGKPSVESDLDILIVIDESNQSSYVRAVKGYLALFDLSIAKDLIVYTKDEFEKAAQKNWTLANRVKKEGRKIYATYFNANLG